MAEDRVDVRFGAQTGELSAGFKEALGIINEGLGGITSSIGLATNAFFGFQIGREILEKVGEAIERVTIDVAEFDEKIEILAKKIGTSTEEATILDTALKNVGVSTDTYTAVLFKLERQVATNEGRLRALGIVTRDHNGQLLQGDDLMRSAIARMQEFRAGTDQNAFALTVFGRGAQEVYQIMRLTPQALADARAEVDKFGAVSEEQAANAHKFQEAVNKLHTEWDLFVDKIGNIILPALTSILDWVQTIPDKIDTLVSAFANMFPFLNLVKQTADALSAATTTINKGAGAGDAIGNALNTGGGGLGGAVGDAFKTGKTGLAFVDPKAADAAQKEFDKWLKDLEADLKKASDLKKAAQISDIATTREGALADLDVQKEAIDRAAALGEISDNEKLARLRDLADKEFQINLDSLNATLNLDALGAQARERIELQLLQLKRQHAAELARLDTQAAVASRAAWTSIVGPIRNAFQQMFTGILQGTQTLRDAMRNLLQNIALSFAQMAAQSLVTWIRTEVAKTEATTIAAAARGAAESEGSKTGLLAHIQDALKSILTDAGKTYAAVFAWAAPFMGPFAAIPAAAATALVIGAETLIPSAAGGYEVPRNVTSQMMIGHPEEVMLPAQWTRRLSAIDDMIGGSGGAPSVTVNITQYGKLPENVLMGQSSVIAKAVAKEWRSFNPVMKPT